MSARSFPSPSKGAPKSCSSDLYHLRPMTLRRTFKRALVPVLGDRRLSRIGAIERRWRTALAKPITPAPPRLPTTPRRSDEATPQRPLRPAAPTRMRKPASRSVPAATLERDELLARLHERLQPRTYLEIGVSSGRSLALSSCRSIGVDPDFHVTVPIACDVRLVRSTSDEFFASDGDVDHFGGTPVDLAFIDGLHLAEFAYRDFLNVERLCSPTSVIVLDDVLPRTRDQAARRRITRAWAGDVYKVVEVLRRRRPDLVIAPVNTHPTGVAVITGLDPNSTVLGDVYDEVLPELQSPDPQHVPQHVIDRRGAVDPQALAQLAVWDRLLRRRGEADRDEVVKELAALRHTFQAP